MLVVVGSLNPSKVEAVSSFLSGVLPEATVQGFAASSGVSEMPLSDEEAIQGALGRARDVLERHPQADWAIGLEGGVQQSPYGMWLCNWGAVMTRAGQCHVGGGVHIQLPEGVSQKILEGCTLSQAMSAWTGGEISRREGAIGILTGGSLTRKEVYEQVLAVTLAPLLQADLYQKG